jgi:hypothetical protein
VSQCRRSPACCNRRRPARNGRCARATAVSPLAESSISRRKRLPDRILRTILRIVAEPSTISTRFGRHALTQRLARCRASSPAETTASPAETTARRPLAGRAALFPPQPPQAAPAEAPVPPGRPAPPRHLRSPSASGTRSEWRPAPLPRGTDHQHAAIEKVLTHSVARRPRFD